MSKLGIFILCWLVLAIGVGLGNITFHPPRYFEYRYLPEVIKGCEEQGYEFSVHGNTATCDEVKSRNIWTIKVNEEILDLK